MLDAHLMSQPYLLTGYLPCDNPLDTDYARPSIHRPQEATAMSHPEGLPSGQPCVATMDN